MIDYIPPYIAVPLAIILWAIVFAQIYKNQMRTKFDDFFAHRRHIRRERRRTQVRHAALATYPKSNAPYAPRHARFR